jgi:P pilus assembly chaperone PapD
MQLERGNPGIAARSPHMPKLAAIALLHLLAVPALALGAIGVDKAEVVLEAGSAGDSVILTNTGATPTFIEVTAREILNPGQAPEQANRGPDPRSLGLLAAPSRLALSPGEQRSLRINSLEAPRDHDRVWRVLVKEVSGPVQAKSSGVAVLLGYDILVIQRPGAARPDIHVTRSGGTLTIENLGNSFALLMDGRQCPSGADSCKEVVGARIYPGQTRTLMASDAVAKIEFKLRLPGGEARTVEY